jgi:alpha-aminoadipate carrier protein LysW
MLKSQVPEREEKAMSTCPECENVLEIELDEAEEGDVVTCAECGTEYEIVGVEPLELARVDDDLDEEDDLFAGDEEEE